MNENHHPFLSRCALILFCGALILPSLLAAIVPHTDITGGAIFFVGAFCLILATVLAITSRQQLPARIVLIGVPIFISLIFGVVLVYARVTRLRAAKQARVVAASRARELEQIDERLGQPMVSPTPFSLRIPPRGH